MKKQIIILSVVSFCAMTASEPDPKAEKFMYGYAANQGNLAAQTFKKAVEGLPEVASAVGEKLAESVLKKFDKEKQKELGANLMNGALTQMCSEERQQIAYDLTKGAVQGAAAAAGAGLVAAKDVVIVKTVEVAVAAKAATVAGATVAAPYVAAGAIVGVAGYSGYRVYKWNEGYEANLQPYLRCLNTHMRDPDCQMNDRDLPKRCESPERKMNESGYIYTYAKPDIESQFKASRAQLKAA